MKKTIVIWSKKQKNKTKKQKKLVLYLIYNIYNVLCFFHKVFIYNFFKKQINYVLLGI